MYDKVKVLEQTTILANRLGQIRMGILDTGIYGASNIDLQKQTMRKSASELVHGVQSGWGRQAVQTKTSEIEGQLQTAAAMGLIGEKDLQGYLGMIDDIYVSVDQEN